MACKRVCKNGVASVFFGVMLSNLGPGASAFAAPVGYSGFKPSTATGTKWPNSLQEGSGPVVTEDRVYTPTLGQPRGFDDLLPYVLAAPDQEDAGSCLYMSLTGIAEWWLAKLNPQMSRAPDGPLDLSERYLMNLAGADEDANPAIPNWKTDSVQLFNLGHRTVLNRDYRFTKGWYTNEGSFNVHPAEHGAVNAEYGPMFNWIDEHSKISSGFVELPHFTRRVLFADPASNQWNVGVAPTDIVEQVKTALRDHHAPVHVIYNHFGYWHAVNIVGYNDELSNDQCSFVTRTIKFFATKAQALSEQAALTDDADAADQLLGDSRKKSEILAKLTKAYHDQGGCHGSKGVFYVRDSIYSAPNEPVYHYDMSRPDKDGHYSKKIVLHEYDWLLYLVNHAVQIDIGD